MCYFILKGFVVAVVICLFLFLVYTFIFGQVRSKSVMITSLGPWGMDRDLA